VRVGPVVRRVDVARDSLRFRERRVGPGGLSHRFVTESQAVIGFIVPRLEIEHAAKNIGRSREIVLRVVNASEIVEGFHVCRPQTEGDPELALRQGVFFIEEKREPHQLVGVGVPVVFGQQLLERVARLLEALLHEVAVGQQKLRRFGTRVAVEKLFGRRLRLIELARLEIGPRQLQCRVVPPRAKVERRSKLRDRAGVLFPVNQALSFAHLSLRLLASRGIRRGLLPKRAGSRRQKAGGGRQQAAGSKRRTEKMQKPERGSDTLARIHKVDRQDRRSRKTRPARAQGPATGNRRSGASAGSVAVLFSLSDLWLQTSDRRFTLRRATPGSRHARRAASS